MSLFARQFCWRLPRRFMQESLKSLLQKPVNNICINGKQHVRYLFSANFLKLDSFTSFSNDVAQKINKNEFMALMEDNYAQGNEILSGDLRLMIALTQSESEYNFLWKMLRRFASNVKGARFRYIVGPHFLRKLHLAGKADFAWAVFNDPLVQTLFEHNTSYLLLIDTLFENGKYQEALDFIESHIESVQENYKSRYSLAFKACSLRLGLNAETYERMKKLDGSKQNKMERKDSVLSIVSALHMNDLDYAKFIIDVHDSMTFSEYFAYANCKVLYFLQNKTLHLAVQELWNLHQADCPIFTFRPVLNDLSEAAEISGDQKTQEKARHLQELYKGKVIETSIEDYIIQSLDDSKNETKKKSRKTSYPDLYIQMRARYNQGGPAMPYKTRKEKTLV
ncbi:hypothetical protein CAPTEDRAFT_224876 [Capitella teleta]|uniref:Pentacotripeptide-repeat region of PRORP domain-containing protein n=1 Tax=Capitella teleta TaxID=283909 RepID=R7VDK5_CAPTE|nr:hypothetical protein CAPTEDRAFT_224876 [Capitella teleta]|eukprot:ELU14396.1 hypothetical protein CAPTEDRAFT_224876 [Capitella teleta]